MEHELKIDFDYFSAVASGEKPFEIRRDDRGYKVGDTLFLRAISYLDYTNESMPGAKFMYVAGMECRKRITYILRNAERYGLKDGFCILGLASK